MSEQSFLTPEQLITRWEDLYKKRLKKSTLNMWRHKDKGPLYVKPLGRVLYPLVEVEKYEKTLEL